MAVAEGEQQELWSSEIEPPVAAKTHGTPGGYQLDPNTVWYMPDAQRLVAPPGEPSLLTLSHLVSSTFSTQEGISLSTESSTPVYQLMQ